MLVPAGFSKWQVCACVCMCVCVCVCVCMCVVCVCVCCMSRGWWYCSGTLLI